MVGSPLTRRKPPHEVHVEARLPYALEAHEVDSSTFDPDSVGGMTRSVRARGGEAPLADRQDRAGGARLYRAPRHPGSGREPPSRRATRAARVPRPRGHRTTTRRAAA